MKEVTRKLVLMFAVLFFVGTQHGGTEEDLDTSPEVLNYFFKLFSDAAFGYVPTECAGWIIRSNEGYKLRKWPTSDEKSMQIWKRPVPFGAVAIAHTHPTSDIQKPSEVDIVLAKRLDLSVYTICRAGIFKATPDGVVIKLQPRNWFKELKAKKDSAKTKSNPAS